MNETQNYGQVPSPEGEFDRESVGFGAFDSLVDYATNGLGITKEEKKPKKLSIVNGELIDSDKPNNNIKKKRKLEEIQTYNDLEDYDDDDDDLIELEEVERKKQSEGEEELERRREVEKTIKEYYIDTRNFLQYCGGIGTYMILGPTGNGKTSCVPKIYEFANNVQNQFPLLVSSVILLSGTGETSDDFNWAGERLVKLSVSDESIDELLAIRVSEMMVGAKELSRKTGKTVSGRDWAEKNPIMVILDDFFGRFNKTQTSRITNLTTKAAHYGIVLLLLLHRHVQVEPVVRQNSNAVICLGCDLDTHKLLSKQIGLSEFEGRELWKWNRQKFHPVIYPIQWRPLSVEFGLSPTPLKLLPYEIENSRLKRLNKNVKHKKIKQK